MSASLAHVQWSTVAKRLSTFVARDPTGKRLHRMTNCRIEHSLAEAVVLFHQPLEVRAAELAANSGAAIQQPGFTRGGPPPTHRLLQALDPGALLPY